MSDPVPRVYPLNGESSALFLSWYPMPDSDAVTDTDTVPGEQNAADDGDTVKTVFGHWANEALTAKTEQKNKKTTNFTL